MGLYRPTVTRKNADGTKYTEKSPIWWGKFRHPETHKWVYESTGTADKAAAKTVFAERQRRAAKEFDGTASSYTEHLLAALIQHVEAYDAWLLTRKQTGDVSHDYVRTVVPRVRKLVNGCGFRRWADISSAKIDAYLSTLDTGTRTRNFYVTAFKQFLNWMHQEKRAPENPIQGKRLSDVTDEKSRRTLDDGEFARLLSAAREAGPFVGVPGTEREMLYLLASQTGLRFNELLTLTWGMADLDSDTPSVKVLAGYSKHREEDIQELSTDSGIIAALKRWRVDTGNPDDGKPIFPTLRAWMIGSKLLDHDLAAAHIPKETTDGKIVFHCLRSQFITALDRAGVTGTAIVRAARHGDPKLTAKYIKLRRVDIRQAVNRLPAVPVGEREKQSKAG